MAPHKEKNTRKISTTGDKDIKTEKARRGEETQQERKSQGPLRRVTSRKQISINAKGLQKLIRIMTEKSPWIRQLGNLCCIASLLETIGKDTW